MKDKHVDKLIEYYGNLTLPTEKFTDVNDKWHLNDLWIRRGEIYVPNDHTDDGIFRIDLESACEFRYTTTNGPFLRTGFREIGSRYAVPFMPWSSIQNKPKKKRKIRPRIS